MVKKVKKIVKKEALTSGVSTPLEKVSLMATNWVGTPASIVTHTLFFIGIFLLRFIGLTVESIMLILTTVVSLEAIYLAIFIQMTVNRNTTSLESVEEDIEELQEDIEDIQEDVEEITEDVDQIQTDDQEEEEQDLKTQKTLKDIEDYIKKVQDDLNNLKKTISH